MALKAAGLKINFTKRTVTDPKTKVTVSLSKYKKKGKAALTKPIPVKISASLTTSGVETITTTKAGKTKTTISHRGKSKTVAGKVSTSKQREIVRSLTPTTKALSTAEQIKKIKSLEEKYGLKPKIIDAKTGRVISAGKFKVDKVAERKIATLKKQLKTEEKKINTHLNKLGLGFISEVFDLDDKKTILKRINFKTQEALFNIDHNKKLIELQKEQKKRSLLGISTNMITKKTIEEKNIKTLKEFNERIRKDIGRQLKELRISSSVLKNQKISLTPKEIKRIEKLDIEMAKRRDAQVLKELINIPKWFILEGAELIALGLTGVQKLTEGSINSIANGINYFYKRGNEVISVTRAGGNPINAIKSIRNSDLKYLYNKSVNKAKSVIKTGVKSSKIFIKKHPEIKKGIFNIIKRPEPNYWIGKGIEFIVKHPKETMVLVGAVASATGGKYLKDFKKSPGKEMGRLLFNLVLLESGFEEALAEASKVIKGAIFSVDEAKVTKNLIKKLETLNPKQRLELLKTRGINIKTAREANQYLKALQEQLKIQKDLRFVTSAKLHIDKNLRKLKVTPREVEKFVEKASKVEKTIKTIEKTTPKIKKTIIEKKLPTVIIKKEIKVKPPKVVLPTKQEDLIKLVKTTLDSGTTTDLKHLINKIQAQRKYSVKILKKPKTTEIILKRSEITKKKIAPKTYIIKQDGPIILKERAIKTAERLKKALIDKPKFPPLTLKNEIANLMPEQLKELVDDFTRAVKKEKLTNITKEELDKILSTKSKKLLQSRLNKIDKQINLNKARIEKLKVIGKLTTDKTVKKKIGQLVKQKIQENKKLVIKKEKLIKQFKKTPSIDEKQMLLRQKQFRDKITKQRKITTKVTDKPSGIRIKIGDITIEVKFNKVSKSLRKSKVGRLQALFKVKITKATKKKNGVLIDKFIVNVEKALRKDKVLKKLTKRYEDLKKLDKKAKSLDKKAFKRKLDDKTKKRFKEARKQLVKQKKKFEQLLATRILFIFDQLRKKKTKFAMAQITQFDDLFKNLNKMFNQLELDFVKPLKPGKPPKKPTRKTAKKPTRGKAKKPTRKTAKKPTRGKAKKPTRKTAKKPTRKTPEKKIRIPKLEFGTKLPKGNRLAFDFRFREKGKVKTVKARLPLNKAIKKATSLIDRTTARSMELIIAGTTKAKDLSKKPAELRKFRTRKTKKVLKLVEKSKYAIDTTGEKKGLSLARALAPKKKKKTTTIKKKVSKKTKKSTTTKKIVKKSKRKSTKL
jgi:hypothetical protein